jgi:transferase CAF17, mitochondrial
VLIPPTVASRRFLFASYPRPGVEESYSSVACPPTRRLTSKPPGRGDCRLSRQYTTGSGSLSPIRSGIAPLSHRRLISVAGPDAAKFLQGLLTNNVDSTRLSPFYAAFLDARGRVLWDVFIWVWPEFVASKGHWACYVEIEADEIERLMKHLKKHKLRSKVEIKEVESEGPEGLRVWATWGGAHEHVQQSSELVGFTDPRAEDMYRYLASADRKSISQENMQVEPHFYRLQRYIQGVAEGAAEIPRENALPMEYNIDLSGGIDFKKGCYVGQELTIRTKHTGVVRKRVLPVQLQSTTSGQVMEESIRVPQHGTDIKALDEDGRVKNGRPTGKFIAGLGNVGLALCRLENMTPMRVTAEGGTFKGGTEFGSEVDGSTVKVVPVLHPWFLQRKEALWDTKKSAKNRSTVVAESH